MGECDATVTDQTNALGVGGLSLVGTLHSIGCAVLEDAPQCSYP
jgi:hypothetical protein